MVNYRDALADGLYELMQCQVPDAGLDARLLLEYVCGTDQNYLYLHGGEALTPKQEETYQALLERRKKREPLQYIIGRQEFMGYPFLCREGVLIPRQDTELLVELVSKMLLPGMSVLDVCTGSGCILISLLRKFAQEQGQSGPDLGLAGKRTGSGQGIRGTGIDISEAAIVLAEENASLNQVDADFFLSDLFENVTEKFDIIVSNPPYIKADVLETLMPEVRDYEPALALDGGSDGLSFYRRIIQQAPQYLKDRGALCFEIGYDEGQEVSEYMKQQGFQNVKIVKDYAGLDRIVVGFL